MKHFAKYIGLDYDELDCWKLVRKIYADEYGIEIPKLPIETQEAHNWNIIELSAEEEGDLLVFRIKELKRHVGIVISDGRMIHSDNVAGVVVERYTGQKWNQRLQRLYRHKQRG